MIERLVVVGGDAAGLSAASQARKRRPRGDLEIIVYERSGWISYSACGEPFFIGGQVAVIEDLLARPPEKFAADDIEVHLFHEVIELDVDKRSLLVRRRDGVVEVGFDQLVYATGAAPIVPTMTQPDAEGVFTLRTLDDAIRVKAAADSSQRAVVIGGGYIGLEVAEALHGRNIPTTLVTSGGGLMNRTLDEDMAGLLTEAVINLGVDVRTGFRVDCLTSEDGRVSGVTVDDDILPADLVVLGVGARPEVTLAKAAGIRLGPTGAVAVDDRQETSVPGVWSAGDCAEASHFLTGRPANTLLGTVANKQGRVAGINIGGGEARFPGVLGTALTRFEDVEVARTGLSELEAREAGIESVAGLVRSTTTAGYLPEARPMTVKVSCEVGTGHLLGAQIVGGPGAGKRIDTIVAAIWGGLGGHDLAMADLGYAPPFSGVWDPVMIAARRAADKALSVIT